MKTRLLIAAFVLVLLSNSFVFLRAAYNRSGQEQQITLTERELRMPFRYEVNKENSGIRLNLHWQSAITFSEENTLYYSRNSIAVSPQQFKALGFEQRCDAASIGHHSLISRRAWVALEFDGIAHQEMIAATEADLREQLQVHAHGEADKSKIRSLEKQLQALKDVRSRLYLVDFDADREVLRERYRNSQNYVLMQAVLSPKNICQGGIGLYVEQLLGDSVYLPSSLRPLTQLSIAGDERYPSEFLLRYQAHIAFGKLNEPWLLSFEVND